MNPKDIREATRLGITVDELLQKRNQEMSQVPFFERQPLNQDLMASLNKDYVTPEMPEMDVIQPSVVSKSPKVETRPVSQQRAPSNDEKPLIETLNPIVKEELAKKYDLSKYSDEKRQKILNQIDKESSGPNWLAGLAALGTGLQGGNASQAGMQFLEMQNNQRRQKLDDFDSSRKTAIDNFKQQKDLDLSDPNSTQSKSFRRIIESKFPDVAKSYGNDWNNVSAADQELIFRPLQLKEQLDSSKERARILSQDKELARQDRLSQKALESEKLNVAQSKQRGLYEMGLKAEQQYLDAVKDKGEYNPTNSGQWIDNSQWAPNLLKNNKAIEAQAAQSAWVEAFLRDASGAAIPQGERLDYAKDFFPQPGDSEQTVKNKAELRRQKMMNARVGSGLPLDDVSQPKSKEVVKKQYSKSANKTKIIYSDGTEEVIDGKQ